MWKNNSISIGEFTYRIHNSKIQRVFFRNERGKNISSLTVPSHFQDKENHYHTIIGIESSPMGPKMLESHPVEFWFKHKYHYNETFGENFWHKFDKEIENIFSYQCQRTWEETTPEIDDYEILSKKYPFVYDTISTAINEEPNTRDSFFHLWELGDQDSWNQCVFSVLCLVHENLIDEYIEDISDSGDPLENFYANGPFSPESQFQDAEDKQGKEFSYQPNFLSVSPFHELRKIKRIELSKGFQEIDSYGFSQMDFLQQIILPDTIEQIGDYAFLFTSSLKEIALPSSIQEIGIATFAFSGIQRIKWPPLDYVPKFTFDHSSLEEIILPNGIKRLEENSFCSCQLKEIQISNSVTRIEQGAFEKCTNLEKVRFPTSLAKLDDCVFKDCTRLTELILPNSLKRIGKSCFENCTSLKRVALPAMLTHIGPDAFKDCTTLSELWVPKTWGNSGDLKMDSAQKSIIEIISKQCPHLHILHLSRKIILDFALPKDINLQYYD